MIFDILTSKILTMFQNQNADRMSEKNVNGKE